MMNPQTLNMFFTALKWFADRMQAPETNLGPLTDFRPGHYEMIAFCRDKTKNKNPNKIEDFLREGMMYLVEQSKTKGKLDFDFYNDYDPQYDLEVIARLCGLSGSDFPTKSGVNIRQSRLNRVEAKNGYGQAWGDLTIVECPPNLVEFCNGLGCVTQHG